MEVGGASGAMKTDEVWDKVETQVYTVAVRNRSRGNGDRRNSADPVTP